MSIEKVEILSKKLEQGILDAVHNEKRETVISGLMQLSTVKQELLKSNNFEAIEIVNSVIDNLRKVSDSIKSLTGIDLSKNINETSPDSSDDNKNKDKDNLKNISLNDVRFLLEEHEQFIRNINNTIKDDSLSRKIGLSDDKIRELRSSEEFKAYSEIVFGNVDKYLNANNEDSIEEVKKFLKDAQTIKNSVINKIDELKNVA